MWTSVIICNSKELFEPQLLYLTERGKLQYVDGLFRSGRRRTTALNLYCSFGVYLVVRKS